MNLLKDILLQLFFLVVPLLFYYSIIQRNFSKSSEFSRQIAVFFCCITSILLCTQYPIQSFPSTIYFSSIPLILVLLYGGYLTQALTALTILAYFTMSSSTTLEVLIQTIIPSLSIFPFIFLKGWRIYSIHTKQTLYVLVACVGGILYFLSVFLVSIYKNLTVAWVNYLSYAFWSGLLFIGLTLLLFHFIKFLCNINELQKNFKKMKKLYHINSMAEEASREFQKPLTMIKGFTHILGAEPNKANKEYVPIILEELQRAEGIVHSYLNLSKAEMFPSRTISSKELLDNVLAGIYTYAKNHNVEIKTKSVRNLRIKGNMEMLIESMTNILKYCIDSNDGAVKTIHLHHFLKRNEVVFEILLNSRDFENEPVKNLSHVPAVFEKEGSFTLNAAYTIFLAHGGDIQVKSKMFKRILVLTLPAQIKRSEYTGHKIIRTY